MYGKSLSLLLLYMMKFSEASEPPTPYYGSNTEPVATDAANHGDCSVDSVPAVSPSQYNSLTSDVRKIYNLSWWLHDQSIKYYNNKVRASCYNYTCMGLYRMIAVYKYNCSYYCEIKTSCLELIGFILPVP